MSQIEKADFTPSAPNFKKLVLMNFQGLTNFPYIEEDFDALTNYGILSKVIEYLNEVISNNNEQNDLMTGLYNAYVSLQDYVNTYFDELDVQEEINNKLDTMAQDGSLMNLIKSYVDPIYQAYENNINTNLENFKQAVTGDLLSMNNKIDNVISDRPIVVSSTDAMTDTTKIYINKTNNKWYYYDGDSWEIGGDYPGTTFSPNSITTNMIASLDYSKVIKDSIKNDFSDVTNWKSGGVSVGGYRTITVDTTSSVSSPDGAITPVLTVDTTKDLYLYFECSIGATGEAMVFVFDGSTSKGQIARIFSTETNKACYVKIAKTLLQTISNLKLYFVSSATGTTTFSNIILNQYDFITLADNLINNLENSYYNNFTNNNFTNITNWLKWNGNPLITQHSKDSFDFVITQSTTDFQGLRSPLSDNFDGFLNVEFDCVVPEGMSLAVYMSKTLPSNGYVNLENNLETGHYSYKIDLSYYNIYQNFENWSFLFSVNKSSVSDLSIIEISNLKFYVSKISELEIYDDNFENLIFNIGNKLTQINKNTEIKAYISNGNEKCITRSNSNGVISVPVVPNKTLIIGNSLLLGNHHNQYYFGLAASDINHDYFYHLSTYITNIKENATFSKISGVDYESATSDSDYNAFISTLNSYLSNDLDLVIIQLGDNVNSSSKINYFRTSCKKLVQYVSNQCPNARIVWVGMWYSSAERINIIKQMAFETGTEFINIQDIRNTTTQSAIGNVVTFPDGYSYTISSSGQASHPGNLGMEKIANRILFSLGIKETE